MLESNYRDLGPVTFPAYAGRQVYMHTFNGRVSAMTTELEPYGGLVSDLCHRAGHTEVAHMTVDEKVVLAGISQRRPGAHVDGRFDSKQMDWRHGGWAHYCNRIPIDRMAVIVASDMEGCIAYPGTFDGEPAGDGDLEHIRDQLGQGVTLEANRAYLLSPDCVHESVVFTKDTRRMFLRIALEP